MSWEKLSLEGFYWKILAFLTVLAVLAVSLAAAMRINMSLTSSACWRFWVFSTYRHAGIASLGYQMYQLIMPAMYFHACVALPSCDQQFGFQGEDYAAYDLPLAVITVAVLVFASRAAEDATQPLSDMS